MSIKHNIKRRMMMVVALTMTVAVLAAGTAHAGTRAFGATLTNSPSQTLVGVGETMHFDVMLTNNDSVDVSGKIWDSLPANVKFVSAYSPQGPCIYEPGGGANGSGKVTCEGGTLAPGESTHLSIAVVPQKAGIITNVADDTAGNEVSASAVVHPAF
jgi:uncharacterized repeat protein (TIGR01451 family)